MIDATLAFIRSEINDYINLKTANNNTLELSHLVGENGEFQVNNLGMSLVNIEEDRTSQPLPSFKENAAGGFDKILPEIKVNLYVLFAANWPNSGNYSEALKHISFILTYFQPRNIFTTAHYPSLPPGVEKLTAELVSLTFEQQNHLWGTLGAKYLPSVLYRFRVLYLEDLIAPLSGEKVRVFKRDYGDLNS